MKINKQLNQAQQDWVDSIFAKLTLDQKIGQLVCERDHTLTRMPEAELTQWLKQYPIGGLFMGSEIIQPDLDDTDKIKSNTAKVNALCKTPAPVLYCGDFEHGIGSEISGYTRLPELMALSAVNDPKLACAYGRVIAREGASLGMRCSFSPVADLNVNMNSWVVNQRATSDDPAWALRILKPLVAGMQEAGVAASVKHFPGDGVDDRNQHVVTSLQALALKDWWRQHGRVFQELFDAGAATTMVGHLGFPALEKMDAATGRYRPATASRKIMTDLLRKQMRYQGVAVTDALSMCGFCSWAPYEQRILDCFNGGADFFLWPNTPEFFRVMHKALRAGRASNARLDESVRRVLELKARFRLFEPAAAAPLSKSERAEHKKIARVVAERSLTLLRNRANLLPLKLKRGAKVLVLIAQNVSSDLKRFNPLQAEFKQRGARLDLVSADDFRDYREKLDDYALIILAGNVGTLNAGGSINLVGKASGCLWPLMARGEKKLIGISFGNPYFLREIASIDTYFNAYSNCEESQRAAVAAIFGEIPFVGRSPVACPFVFKRGDGCKT